MQTQLTNSLVQVQIAENQGEAELARARKQAEQMVVTAQAESQQRVLAGRGEGSRLLQVGLSEASVLLRKIQSFSDPRLYALSLVAEQLAHSSQPLVPERVFIAGDATATTADGHGRRGQLRACSACSSTCSSPRSPASSSPTPARPRPCRSSPTGWPGRPWNRCSKPSSRNRCPPTAPTSPTPPALRNRTWSLPRQTEPSCRAESEMAGTRRGSRLGRRCPITSMPLSRPWWAGSAHTIMC